jgi:hypothetical protein
MARRDAQTPARPSFHTVTRPVSMGVERKGPMQDNILIEDGLLVLADISGFTAFVAAAELEHGAEVTATLLETLMRSLSPPLEIQELEGDAVFAIGPDRTIPDGRTVGPLLAGAFAAFRKHQRLLAADVSCACRACRETTALDLKLIAHHGRFVRQLVGGRSRVTGPAVVLAHRLLKNSVGAGAYLLLTETALERIGMDPVAGGMRRHLVSYPHLGAVPCFVGDLEPAPPPTLAGVDGRAA